MMENTKLSQLLDVYDVWYEPWWHSKSFYAGIIFLTISVACLLIYALWKKYMRAQQFSFEQIALLQLQKLHQRAYESDDSMRDAYFTMTMIMKTYLSKRYQIKLLNKTDSEIVDSIKPIVPVAIFATLQELFQRAYQIKFAYAAISLKMLYDDIDYMQRIIYKTIKQDSSSGDF